MIEAQFGSILCTFLIFSNVSVEGIGSDFAEKNHHAESSKILVERITIGSGIKFRWLAPAPAVFHPIKALNIFQETPQIHSRLLD